MSQFPISSIKFSVWIRPFYFLIVILHILAFPAFLPITNAQTTSPFGQQKARAMDKIKAMEQVSGATPKVTISKNTGLATFLTTKPGKEIPIPGLAFESSTNRALSFLSEYGDAFGLRDTSEFRAIRAKGPDEVGIEHVRIQQLFNGIPITGGQLTIHMRGSMVTAIHSKTLGDIQLQQTTPTVQPDAAITAAQQLVKKYYGITNATYSNPRLEVFNRGLLEGTNQPTQLAWFIEAKGRGIREFIWINALTGGHLLNFSQMPDAKNRQVYNTNNSSNLPGTPCRFEGQGTSGNTDCNLAYDYSGDTYDYFFQEHGRDSYDGAGATLFSTVDYCPSSTSCPYANAFWNGSQMVYGDGFSAADDVVAHELTHAVTEHSANLFYYMQSGALNESYSDIFGETVDLINIGGTDSLGVRWQIGEDIPGIGAIRNMMTPTAFGDPGKVSDSQFVCATPGGDAGGVHSNSGVPNHAYALMVDGGTYNGFTITGIDLAKAGRVQYRALTQYLTSASNFLDNYNALNQSCTDLMGSNGITADDCLQIQMALDAVEMTNPWPCAPSQASIPPLCPTPQTMTNLFFDDLENTGSGNWTITPISGTSHWFYPGSANSFGIGPFATSGIQNFWGYNRPSTGDSAIAMTGDIAIPATGALMQFNHSYGFEESSSPTRYWDGGVVEYSANSGTTWIDAGALITSGQTYGGTLTTTNSTNPLAGENAFVTESFGYTATQLDLSSLANQNVRFRFRIGTDSTIDDYGWFIDDVRIYQCLATQAPTVTINQAGGQADPTSASPINFTVVFSEPVTGFTTGDVTLGGTAGATTGTVSESAPNDGTTYRVAVSGMTGDGTVIATIAAGVATDSFGNPNAASTSFDNEVTIAFTVLVPPAITGVTPPSGPVGTAVTVTGMNFTGATEVAFNGLPDIGFTVPSDTVIQATVPGGATTGPITVTTPEGTATSATAFTLTVPGGSNILLEEVQTGGSSASSFVSTAAGLTAVEGHLYLASISYKPNTSVLNVSGLGLVWTEVTSQCAGRSQTGVSVWMAPGSPSGVDEVVTATLSNAPSNAVIAVARYAGASEIGNVEAANTNGVGGAGGCAGGTDSNAYALPLTTTVADAVVYGAVAMRLRSHTPGANYTEQVEVQQGSGGNAAGMAGQDRTVGTASAVTVDGFFSGTVDWAMVAVELRPGAVSNLPTITSVTPPSGPVGTAVTVTGTNLTGATEVAFNSVPNIGFTIPSDTEIQTTVPGGATTGPITVTTPEGTATSATAFSVLVPPTITGFTPGSGPIGTPVTITGMNFTGATEVAFNNSPAPGFLVMSDTAIQATVPTGATTGPIGVSNTAGADTSIASFTVTFAPTITSVTPPSGPVGTAVTVTGTNFTGATEVAFNGLPDIGFTVPSDTVIQTTVPGGATTGPITVTTPEGTATSATAFTVLVPPTITGFTPGSGPIGTPVTLTGMNFTGATEVAFNGLPDIGFTVPSDTVIQATVPGGATTGPITVTTPEGTATSATAFTVTVPGGSNILLEEVQTGGSSASSFVSTAAGLTAVEGHLYLASISYKPNTSVLNVSGLGLVWTEVTSQCAGRSQTGVSVWMAPGSPSGVDEVVTATLSSAPSNAVIAVARYAGASGIGNVEAANTNGVGGAGGCAGGTDSNAYAVPLTTTVADAVVYGAVAMRNRSHTPGADYTEQVEVAQGSGGGMASIAGQDRTVGTASAVTVDGFFSGTVDWAVVAVELQPGAVSNLPAITGFTPGSGPVGTVVTLTGINFTGATQVAFNGVPAVAFTVTSDTALHATVPVGATTGLLSVTTPEGTGTSATAFTVIEPPTITGFTPGSGPVGTVVTLTGTNLTGATQVAFNGVPAVALTVPSNTEIQATVPVGASSGLISVTNSAGANTSAASFLVTPGISSFTPGNGPVGTVVTLTGTNFTGATQVAFNGVPAVTFTVTSHTELQATVPAGATTGLISVTTPEGSDTSATAFTVTGPPSISGFIPASGLVGTVVTLTGSNFTGATQVTFNGVVADSFTVISDTEFQATVPTGATTGLISVTTPEGSDTSATAFTVTGPGGGNVEFEEVQTGGSTVPYPSSVTTSQSLTAVDGHVYLASISWKSHTIVSVTGVSGLNLVWTEVAAQCSGRNQTGVSVWMAQGTPSGMNDVVTATLPGLTPPGHHHNHNAVIAVTRYSGASGIGTVVSANTNGIGGGCSGGTDSNAYAFPLTTTVADTVVYGAVAMRNRSHTPGADYTEQVEVAQGSGGDMASIAGQDRTVGTASAVTVDGFFSRTVDWAMVAVELRP